MFKRNAQADVRPKLINHHLEIVVADSYRAVRWRLACFPIINLEALTADLKRQIHFREYLNAGHVYPWSIDSKCRRLDPNAGRARNLLSQVRASGHPSKEACKEFRGNGACA